MATMLVEAPFVYQATGMLARRRTQGTYPVVGSFAVRIEVAEALPLACRATIPPRRGRRGGTVDYLDFGQTLVRAIPDFLADGRIPAAEAGLGMPPLEAGRLQAALSAFRAGLVGRRLGEGPWWTFRAGGGQALDEDVLDERDAAWRRPPATNRAEAMAEAEAAIRRGVVVASGLAHAACAPPGWQVRSEFVPTGKHVGVSVPFVALHPDADEDADVGIFLPHRLDAAVAAAEERLAKKAEGPEALPEAARKPIKVEGHLEVLDRMALRQILPTHEVCEAMDAVHAAAGGMSRIPSDLLYKIAEARSHLEDARSRWLPREHEAGLARTASKLREAARDIEDEKARPGTAFPMG